MAEEWNPERKPAPEFRGVGLTYEQFNQMHEMSVQMAKLIRWQIISNSIQAAATVAAVVLAVYVIEFLQANDVIGRWLG